MLNWCKSKKLDDAGIPTGRIITKALEFPGYPNVSANVRRNCRIPALDREAAREYARNLPPMVDEPEPELKCSDAMQAAAEHHLAKSQLEHQGFAVGSDVHLSLGPAASQEPLLSARSKTKEADVPERVQVGGLVQPQLTCDQEHVHVKTAHSLREGKKAIRFLPNKWMKSADMTCRVIKEEIGGESKLN